MPKDFAKQHRTTQVNDPGMPRSRVFLAGFIMGFFVCFLGALWYFIPEPEPIASLEDLPVAQPEVQAEEMQWDFYEIFPRSVVPVVEEYAETGDKIAVDQHSWILQAGSFAALDDADEMRAELILLGLDAAIATVEVTGMERHRVIVGPFETELERNRAQDKLAQAEIASLAIKIPR